MKKILIVDDDPDIQRGFNIRLRAEGYDTAVAGDAVMAVMEARRQKPDLILLDIGLPGGDGIVVMERFKAIPALGLVPVIVVSAREPIRNQALAAGARAFFLKPADNGQLLAAVRDALAERGGE